MTSQASRTSESTPAIATAELIESEDHRLEGTEPIARTGLTQPPTDGIRSTGWTSRDVDDHRPRK